MAIAVTQNRFDGILFERNILNLIKEQAIREGKIIFIGNELPSSWDLIDALAPSGIFDLEGPCIIEIKNKLHTDSFSKFNYLLHKYSDRIRSAVLVVNEIEQSRGRFIEKLNQTFPNIVTKIYSRYELEREINSKSKHTSLETHDLKSIIESVKENERNSTNIPANTNKQHIAALKTSYNDDKLALFIGAGLSKSVGLPDWPQLVRLVAAKVFDNHADSPLSEIERDEVQNFFEKEVPASPLIVARLLQSSLKDKFVDAVREALYENIESTSSSKLLEEIGALCMPKRDKIGISGVVNYNFDDLLEKELSRRDIAHNSILSEGYKLSSSELPIYHVHGYLPRSITLEKQHEEALVLSEDAYHTQFIDPFIWTNIIQLNLLRNNVCLFIGISLTDPNHRRLLEITAKRMSGANHYAIMTDHWQGEAAKKLSSKTQALALAFRQIEEESFQSLGINIIWVNTHADIPNVLADIRNS